MTFKVLIDGWHFDIDRDKPQWIIPIPPRLCHKMEYRS